MNQPWTAQPAAPSVAPPVEPATILVAEFSPRLYRYALVRLGRADLAEDAVAETLCRLVEKGPALDGPTPHVHGWCVRCIVNVCREIARRPRFHSTDTLSIETMFVAHASSSRRQPADRASDPVAPAFRMADYAHAIDSSETRHLVDAMRAIPERQAEAVTLRVLMGLSVAAAAEAMHCAQGTIKALTHQGLASLRARLAFLESTFRENAG